MKTVVFLVALAILPACAGFGDGLSGAGSQISASGKARMPNYDGVNVLRQRPF